MAKKSKKAKVTRRRRRIGAVALNANNPMVMYGSLALGFLMGNKINEQLAKVVPAGIDGKLVGAGQAGLGALLLMSKKKTTFGVIAGGLLAGSGAKKLMGEFGIGSIGGYQMVPSIGGYQAVPSIGGSVSRVGGYTPGSNGLNGYTPGSGGIGGYTMQRDAVSTIAGMGSDLMD